MDIQKTSITVRGKNISTLGMYRNLIGFILSICLLFFMAQCKFDEINQPKSAQPGEIIEISVAVSEDYSETTNPHKGLLCVLVPNDWAFIYGEYSSTVGNGLLEKSPDWTDSAEVYYPAEQFGENMKWIGLLSDTGYTYDDIPKFNAAIQLQVGEMQGCFQLAYLASKATKGLLGTGWAALSYPHSIGIPDSCLSDQTYKAEPVPEWDALFNRTSGWTGSDAAYSIPLSGIDVPSDSENERTLFSFGDTFIGEVDSNGLRQNSILIRNTLAVLDGKLPDPEHIKFIWNTDTQGQPKEIFQADTPQSNPGDWIWPMDGIVLNDKIYIFGLRLKETNNFFDPIGVTLISFSLDSNYEINDYEHVDTPLFYEEIGNNSEIILGQAVMPITANSGNPNPDGYIYIYGPRSGSLAKELIVARVLPEDIEDFSKYRYWNGENWSPDITSCVTITNSISQEFSVSPLGDGRFILVFQVGSQVAIRFGESPVGPFDFYRVIYKCPEPEENTNIFVYNAKAHPHLSNPDELLISYNVNTLNFDAFIYADIYRPRFIKLNLSECDIDREKIDYNVLKEFSLSKNYPNPFNNGTNITYKISKPSIVRLTVYNINGNVVNVLENGERSAGKNSVYWDGKDINGVAVASGIYFYSLQLSNKGGIIYLETRKMALLK
jgi:hypothetical protein